MIPVDVMKNKLNLHTWVIHGEISIGWCTRQIVLGHIIKLLINCYSFVSSILPFILHVFSVVSIWDMQNHKIFKLKNIFSCIRSLKGLTSMALRYIVVCAVLLLMAMPIVWDKDYFLEHDNPYLQLSMFKSQCCSSNGKSRKSIGQLARTVTLEQTTYNYTKCQIKTALNISIFTTEMKMFDKW